MLISKVADSLVDQYNKMLTDQIWAMVSNFEYSLLNTDQGKF